MTTRKPDHRVYRFRMLSRLIFVALLSIGSDCDEEEDRRPEPPLEKYTTTVAPAVIPMSLQPVGLDSQALLKFDV